MANEKRMAQFIDEKVKPIVETTVPDLIKQLDATVKRIEAIETKPCDCNTVYKDVAPTSKPKKVKK